MPRLLIILILTGTLCATETHALEPQSAGCVSPPAGLVDWWRAEGDALDAIGTNNGILVDGMSFGAGVVGSGFLFSGNGDDYVQLPADLFPFPVSGNGRAPFSFEFWFATSSGGVILGQQDTVPFSPGPSGYAPALYVGTNGALYAALFWDQGLQLGTLTPVNEGRFHHVAVTYDGGTETLYLDGAPSVSTPFVQQGYATTYQYQLGTGWTDNWTNTPGGWFPFAGVLDELSLYNRALGAAEVAAIYHAGRAGKCLPTGGAALRHRYSFDEAAGTVTVHDSAGGADGALLFASTLAPYTNGTPDGSAFTGTGQLQLQGVNGYASLPPGLISSLSNVSFEVWATWNGPSTSTWQRIFDFGFNDVGTNASGTGSNYVMLSPSRGGTEVLGFEETTVNPFGALQDPKALVLYGPTPMPTGQETYLAVTYDPIGGASQLFVNGALVSSASMVSLNPLAQFEDYNDWLGRSQWDSDPFFSGQYDEFRIWEGILSPAQVALHSRAGPNRPLVVQPYLNLAQAGSWVTLSWSTNDAAGFQLESAPSFPSPNWHTVTNAPSLANGFYQVTFPVARTPAFYRLRF